MTAAVTATRRGHGRGGYSSSMLESVDDGAYDSLRYLALPQRAPRTPHYASPSHATPATVHSLALFASPFAVKTVERAECALCFDPLCIATAAVFYSHGRRICSHFFHHHCAQNLSPSICPLCRRTFETVEAVPPLEADPAGWFRIVDLDGDGKLSQHEVLEVLKAQLPIDHHSLEGQIAALWGQWDTNNVGYLTLADITAADTGLLSFISANFPSSEAITVPQAPHITDKGAWFNFFDVEGKGVLDKDQVTRALIKTFGMATNVRHMCEMKSIVDSVWAVFAQGGVIGHDEFVSAEGLADAIIASLPPPAAQGDLPAEDDGSYVVV